MWGFASTLLSLLDARGEQKWSLRIAPCSGEAHKYSQGCAVPAPGLFNVKSWLSSSQRKFLTLIRENKVTAVKGQRTRTMYLCTLMIFMIT